MHLQVHVQMLQPTELSLCVYVCVTTDLQFEKNASSYFYCF